MTIFTMRKNSTGTLSNDGSTTENLTQKIASRNANKKIRGNIFFALFAAIAMVGAVGYGFNTVIRGPLTSMSDVTRRTVTENFVITASRVAIVNATTQQANAGDCDDDGMIEPLPYRAPAGAPAPAGGGLLPLDLVPDTTDPWNTQYGYCAWDAGSSSVSDAVAGCGGATPRRLEGSPTNNRYSIAIISAGKDKKFNTTCNAYVDNTTNLLVKTDGSDDIVLAYTYAEANNLGNGLWKEKTADPTTLQTEKSVESTGGATFADKVVLTGNTATGGGLVLPGDPGDDSLSGPCNSVNERQLRRNTSTSPPTLEICDYNGGAGLGWTPVSGSGTSTPSGPADCTGLGDDFVNDPVSGHCYFVDNAGDWYPDANAVCTGINPSAYLVSITSSAENTLIGAQGWDWGWIGASDDPSAGTTEGNFVYTTGELAGTQFWTGGLGGSAVGGQFSNWEAGHPDNFFGDSDCVLTVNSGEWHVHGCSQVQPVICEVPGAPTAPTGPADCTGLGDQSYNDPVSGHCYYYESTNTFTAATAHAACAADGAYLAVPSSSTENNLIFNTFPQDGPFIGVTDAGTDGTWHYMYGEKAGTVFWNGGIGGSTAGGQYSNWDAGEGGGSEDCAAWNWNGGNNWIDVDCSGYTSNYVCEKTGVPSGGGGGGSGIIPAPVSRWKLDESAGATAVDSVGGRNGTVSGSTTWQPSGGSNAGALQFNAGGGKIEVPRNVALEPSAISISAWVKRNGAQAQWAMVITKGWQGNSPPTYHSYSLQFNDNDDDAVGFVTGSSGGGDFLPSTAGVIPDNTWVHVLGTFDPNGSAPQKKLYINGVLNASATITNALIYDSGSGGDLSFGDDETNGAKFVGALDDVRVYNRALTAEQVQGIYEATSPPRPSLRFTNRAGKLFTWGIGDASEQLGNGVGALPTNAPYAVVNGDGFVQASTSGSTGCGVKENGTVWCWGADAIGQLGNGATTGNQGIMTQAVGITNAVKVSTTLVHSCALLADGQIMCWGSNGQGQLGTGDTTTSTVPVKATTYNDFTDVATAIYGATATTCGLRYSGSVICWGEGSGGELGNGANADSLSPVPVSNISDFVMITGSINNSSAGAHFCGVAKSGTAYCWGSEKGAEFGNGATGSSNVPSPVSTYTDWKQISTMNTVTCGVRANGLGYCWGTETAGNLGNGATSTAQATPVQLDTNAPFKKIEPSLSASCGIASNNALYCWGSNVSGYLGMPSLSGTYVSPVAVNGRNVIDLSVSSTNFLIIMDETATDSIPADKNLNLISAGRETSCAIIKDGGAACWGDDTNGELGNGAITGTQYTPTAVNDAGPWTQITNSLGGTIATFACGLKGDASAWCWGYGADGQLGNGTSSQTSPVVVDNVNRKWSQISAGSGFACGIEPDGDLYCWGIGIGATPTQVQAGKVWTKISAGKTNSCGITNDGNAWCWGQDALGQLGNGSATTTTQTNAVQVSGRGPWVDIAAGDVTCGIKANGSLWCFGEGSDYMNGNNSTTDYAYPQPVISGGQYIDVSVGYDHACAMRTDYTAYCWGLNGTGQIGNAAQQGATAQRPVRVELTPQRAGWEWNATDAAIKPATGLSPMIGTSRWISDDGAANKGLNLGALGRAQLRQSTANQLLVETKGVGYDAQATLRAPSAVIGADITTGLVRHFKLDDTTGASIVDTMAVGNGTWSDGSGNVVVQETVPGVNGTALRFDGTNDYINIPTHASLDMTDALTISAWIKPMASVNNFRSLVHRESVTDGEEYFGLMIGGTLDQYKFLFAADVDGTWDGVQVRSAKSANDYLNKWVHVVGTYDGHVARIYTDGVLDTTSKLTGGFNPTTRPLNIGAGRNMGALGEYFNGMIDDVRIYNRALDPGEVNQLYYYTSQYVVTRSMGVDSVTGNFEITRNNSTGADWLSTLSPDLEISSSGNVGIGTKGAPAAKLDVNGAIKLGNETTCNGAAEGTIRWTGTAMEYCNGTWQPLVSTATGGGGGTGGTGLWNTTAFMRSAVALKDDGTAWTYGWAGAGRLGNNQTAADAYVPAAVQVHSNVSNTGWSDWLSISGFDTSCGLRVDGSAWCWGDGEWGNIGDGDTNDFLRPTIVRNTADNGQWYDWVYIAAGWEANCGIRASGVAYCWGLTNASQGGDGSTSGLVTTPQPVHDLDGAATAPTSWSDWKTVENSARTSAGLRANGEAYAWGLDVYGLGNQPATGTFQPRPRVIKSAGGGAAWTDWKQIVTGEGGICGIRANGLMYCLGNGSAGELGDAGFGYSDYPKLVNDSDCSAGGDDKWVMVSKGTTHVCAIKAGGTLWCWGRAAEGQAGNNDFGGGGGDGNNGNNYCMHQVLNDTGGTGWTDWVNVMATGNFTCGGRANGTMWCWGAGAAADGTEAPLPVQVLPQ